MQDANNGPDNTRLPDRQSLKLADVLQKPFNEDTLLYGIFPVFVHPHVAQSEQVSSMIRQTLADPGNWLPRIALFVCMCCQVFELCIVAALCVRHTLRALRLYSLEM